ncbi:hypothetical protein ATCC90586_004828 [Pythium insidiosum]|nr:hypothetical protein ATCC90586_004828 [Pythium insidiosum]
MGRRRRVEERERDIAIDEAARAICRLRDTQEELEALRTEHEKLLTARTAWASRHEQILWHVSRIADTLWRAMVGIEHMPSPLRSPRFLQPRISLDEARVLALEAVEGIVPVHETHLYEEMHELYSKIARMEAQQSRMLEKLREVKDLNDQLNAALTAQQESQQRSTTGHHLASLALDEPQRENDDDSLESGFLAEEEPLEGTLSDSDKDELPASTGSGGQRSNADGIGAPRKHTVQLVARELDPESTDPPESGRAQSTDTEAVRLLQAQLAMYIRQAERHRQWSAG